jgi:hypothetical protein
VVGLVFEKKVIEFTITVYENIHTKEKSSAIFPEGVNAPVQFSPELKTMPVYLRDSQHISYERISQLFFDINNISVCPATIKNLVEVVEI